MLAPTDNPFAAINWKPFRQPLVATFPTMEGKWCNSTIYKSTVRLQTPPTILIAKQNTYTKSSQNTSVQCNSPILNLVI